MNFRLVDSRWDKELDDSVTQAHSRIAVVCPFIKKRTAERLLARGAPDDIKVITRFNLMDFHSGVSDIAALEALLRAGAQIRGVKHLHAKMYLFGRERSIVTSANLTESALLHNHELGFVADDPTIFRHCKEYFGRLWERAGANLTLERLSRWSEKLLQHQLTGGRPSQIDGLGDEGTDLGIETNRFDAPSSSNSPGQYYVKFFGGARYKIDRATATISTIDGSHWACAYPKNRRPRSVQDGALMFMARFVKKPGDFVVFGRAIAMSYIEGRDDASPEDIERRPWKENWPHYIRVHSAEFVDGTIANGVSLYELMDELKSDSFALTQRNARSGSGNTNPRGAYRQQSAVKLSEEGFNWLNERLDKAFRRYGTIAPAEMEGLDWPTLPSVPGR